MGLNETPRNQDLSKEKAGLECWAEPREPGKQSVLTVSPDSSPKDKDIVPYSIATGDEGYTETGDQPDRKRGFGDIIMDNSHTKLQRLDWNADVQAAFLDEEALSEQLDYGEHDYCTSYPHEHVEYEDQEQGEGEPGNHDPDAGPDDIPQQSENADSNGEAEESSDYDSDEEEVELVMNEIWTQLSQGAEEEPLSVLLSFLKKHDIDADEVLSLVEAAGSLNLASIARALVAYKRSKGTGFLPERELVVDVKDFSTVVDLVKRSKKIIVLSGAGVSVSCGIPDFRSPGGLYDTVRDRFGLDEPQALFDINYFKQNPKPFFTLAKDIFPGGAVKPSIAHEFVRKLEAENQLLRNYTQNIDGLEAAAGVQKVIPCHGSFATATCRRCKSKFSGDSIREAVINEKMPRCTSCGDRPTEEGEEEPIVKPDIVFFGEQLVDAFFENVNEDLENADLMIVMGTSLKVAPVSRLPSTLDKKIPRILINREVVGSHTQRFDVELLGNCDEVVKHLLHCMVEPEGAEASGELPFTRVGDNRFIFEGARVDV